jgi:prevent-host-death family protein
MSLSPPDRLEPIPAARLRRELRTILRRLGRGEGPFRITRRNGPDLVLLPISSRWPDVTACLRGDDDDRA